LDEADIERLRDSETGQKWGGQPGGQRGSVTATPEMLGQYGIVGTEPLCDKRPGRSAGATPSGSVEEPNRMKSQHPTIPELMAPFARHAITLKG